MRHGIANQLNERNLHCCKYVGIETDVPATRFEGYPIANGLSCVSCHSFERREERMHRDESQPLCCLAELMRVAFELLQVG